MADSPDPQMPSPQAARELARRLAEPELQVAAAALTGLVSPPLGVAVAVGSALRSARVRATLRSGTVQTLARAMALGERLTAVAERIQEDAGPSSNGAGARDHERSVSPERAREGRVHDA